MNTPHVLSTTDALVLVALLGLSICLALMGARLMIRGLSNTLKSCRSCDHVTGCRCGTDNDQK